MASTPIAVMASGRGSNFDAMCLAIDTGRLDAEIRLVLSDKAQAPVLEKARARGIRAVCVEPMKGKSPEKRREEHESRVLAELEKAAPRFLVLAGYMRVLTPTLIEAYRSERGYARIVNIHPSILPAFPGVGGYAQAFAHGVKLTGVTVHLVESELDSGPICAQESFSIADCRSVEEVESRGLAVEHRLFPETLKWVLPEAFDCERRALTQAASASGDGSDSGRFCVRAH